MAGNFEVNKQFIKDYNIDLFKRLQPGDLVKVKRNPVFWHWMVYIGDEDVVHVTGDDITRFNGSGSLTGLISGYKMSMVLQENIWNVVQEDQMVLDNEMDRSEKPFSGEIIVRRALRRKGAIEYHSALKNCEHFAKWCRYDVERSTQSRNMLIAATVGGVVVGAVGGPMLAVCAGMTAAGKLLYDSVQRNRRQNEPLARVYRRRNFQN